MVGLCRALLARLTPVVSVLLFAVQPLSAVPDTPPAATTRPASAEEWRAAAREDIEAAYAAFRERHPGMFDPDNPGFPDRLRRAREAALAFTARVVDAEGHMRALALFSAGLGDGHARVSAYYSGHGALLWPGFVAVWRGDALYIREPADGGAPRGSVLLGCDGRGVRELIRDSAFFFYGRPEEAGQWWIDAPFFFERVASPYETLPRECSFRQPGGRTASYRLDWRPVPGAIERAWMEGARTDPVGLSEPRPGIHLITLSSFSPDEEGRAAYARLFANLDANAARLAADRAIVIDLRRNGGGSSSWSEQVAKRLWGEAAVTAAQARYFRHTRIRWLAHPANIAYFRRSADRLRAEGRSEDAGYLAEIAAHLETAHQRGDRFYVENYGAGLASRARPAAPRRLPHVYVITDGNCASACLDAVDLFTRFPNVKLVGAPTSADSTYLEVIFEPLPSGRAGIVLPTKIWVGRPRRAGEVYRPDILVMDLDWTTATMLDHIERDLSH